MVTNVIVPKKMIIRGDHIQTQHTITADRRIHWHLYAVQIDHMDYYPFNESTEHFIIPGTHSEWGFLFVGREMNLTGHLTQAWIVIFHPLTVTLPSDSPVGTNPFHIGPSYRFPYDIHDAIVQAVQDHPTSSLTVNWSEITEVR
ncbi:MAG: hypothetical protein C7B44_05685 [Sulfobacillus thermosulfidooxidans]|uniref:Uncharacterized protein n=1 Tax=Sulfobacillus acidophilus TaxID=53633 RepID=A0A2T2WCG1_9FIRM|nr:MAG: hypothetical protein C7B45_17565 [Sulfobacillus acidophilus]PSR37055.1 MAG: hypothetical protein C7B44_05685 [Sulfobacillus thermosulfidooxidans]